MLAYDEKLLLARLTKLDSAKRTVFAAACAERLFPSLEAYSLNHGSRDHTKVRAALDAAWMAPISEGLYTKETLERYAATCRSLIPNEDDYRRGSADAFADNAATSAYYALECASTGNPQAALWAATGACESVHYLVQNRDKPPFDKEGLAEVIASAEFQRELEHQNEDLAELETSLVVPLAEVTSRMRERAVGNAVVYHLDLK